MSASKCQACAELQQEFDEYKMLGEEIESELERQVVAMRETLEGTDKELERITERFKLAGNELRKCEKLLADEQDKVASLTAERDSHKRKKVSLENKCDSMEENLRSLEMEVETKGCELDRIKEDLIIERMDRVTDVEGLQEERMLLEQRLRELEDIEAELLKKLENATKPLVSIQENPKINIELSTKQTQTENIEIKSENIDKTELLKQYILKENKQVQTDHILSGGRRASLFTSFASGRHDIAAMSQNLLNDNEARRQTMNIGRKRDSILEDDGFLRAELAKLVNRDRLNSISSHDSGKLSTIGKHHNRSILLEMPSEDEEDRTHIPLPCTKIKCIIEHAYVSRDAIHTGVISHIGNMKPSVADSGSRPAIDIDAKRRQRASVIYKSTCKPAASDGGLRPADMTEIDALESIAALMGDRKTVEWSKEEKPGELDFIKQPVKTIGMDKFLKNQEKLIESPKARPKKGLKYLTVSGTEIVSIQGSPKRRTIDSPLKSPKSPYNHKIEIDPNEELRKVHPRKSYIAKLYK